MGPREERGKAESKRAGGRTAAVTYTRGVEPAEMGRIKGAYTARLDMPLTSSRAGSDRRGSVGEAMDKGLGWCARDAGASSVRDGNARPTAAESGRTAVAESSKQHVVLKRSGRGEWGTRRLGGLRHSTAQGTATFLADLINLVLTPEVGVSEEPPKRPPNHPRFVYSERLTKYCGPRRTGVGLALATQHDEVNPEWVPLSSPGELDLGGLV